jgi:molecular chaperone Hsp33
MPDTLIRFDFVDAAIRGELVRLEDTWAAINAHRAYPPAVRAVLGQMTAASALLAASLKFEGSVALQLQGQGPLKVAVAEAHDDLKIRATADWDGPDPQGGLAALVARGTFSVVLENLAGEPYQGIVPVESDGVGPALENYMHRSQQIPTRLLLACNDGTCCGLLLQRMPDQSSADADAWARVGVLAGTLGTEELLATPPETLLRRLFREEVVRVYDPREPRFGCRCSRQRVEGMLRMIGRDEAQSVLDEQGLLRVDCEFCNQAYVFDAPALEAVFGAGNLFGGTQTRQ